MADKHIPVKHFKALAQRRLKSAKSLLDSGDIDDGLYLIGYATEMGLKYAIGTHLNWELYPPKLKNEPFGCFKTHNLEALIQLSGFNSVRDSELMAEWNQIKLWESEARYDVSVSATEKLEDTIKATEVILNRLGITNE